MSQINIVKKHSSEILTTDEPIAALWVNRDGRLIIRNWKQDGYSDAILGLKGYESWKKWIGKFKWNILDRHLEYEPLNRFSWDSFGDIDWELLYDNYVPGVHHILTIRPRFRDGGYKPQGKWYFPLDGLKFLNKSNKREFFISVRTDFSEWPEIDIINLDGKPITHWEWQIEWWFKDTQF